jgi:3,4-dihydroxy-2-butanone 4-phosphate synthase
MRSRPKMLDEGTVALHDRTCNQWNEKRNLSQKDNDDRVEGDLILPAAFCYRKVRGVYDTPLKLDSFVPLSQWNSLKLKSSIDGCDNTEAHQCKFTVTVDLKLGNSTCFQKGPGLNRFKPWERNSRPAEFSRPGHMSPPIGWIWWLD